MVEEHQVAALLAAQRSPPERSASSTYRSPTAVVCTAMPASRIVWWKPRLLITVATTVSSLSAPRSCSASAQIARIASPSTTSPARSTARQRSASPSWAMPRSAPCAPHGLDHRAEMGGADAIVDVPAVGVAADGVHLGAGPAVDLGGGGEGGAMRGVDDQRRPVSGCSTVESRCAR